MDSTNYNINRNEFDIHLVHNKRNKLKIKGIFLPQSQRQMLLIV